MSTASSLPSSQGTLSVNWPSNSQGVPTGSLSGTATSGSLPGYALNAINWTLSFPQGSPPTVNLVFSSSFMILPPFNPAGIPVGLTIVLTDPNIEMVGCCTSGPVAVPLPFSIARAMLSGGMRQSTLNVTLTTTATPVVTYTLILQGIDMSGVGLLNFNLSWTNVTTSPLAGHSSPTSLVTGQ